MSNAMDYTFRGFIPSIATPSQRKRRVRAFNPTTYAAVIAGAGIVVACCAQAAPSQAFLEWKCVQQRDAQFNVLCLANPRTPDPAAAAPLAGADSDRDDGTAQNAPSRPPLMERAHDMRPVATRDETELQAVRAWHVPLYKLPSNPGAVRQLLESVLCGSAARCAVTYDP